MHKLSHCHYLRHREAKGIMHVIFLIVVSTAMSVQLENFILRQTRKSISNSVRIKRIHSNSLHLRDGAMKLLLGRRDRTRYKDGAFSDHIRDYSRPLDIEDAANYSIRDNISIPAEMLTRLNKFKVKLCRLVHSHYTPTIIRGRAKTAPPSVRSPLIFNISFGINPNKAEVFHEIKNQEFLRISIWTLDKILHCHADVPVENVGEITDRTALIRKVSTDFSSKDNVTVNEQVGVIRQERKSQNVNIFEEFKISVARIEKEFYKTTFNKLSNNSPKDRRENGISFVLSALWLHMVLLLLSSEGSLAARYQVENATRFSKTPEEEDSVIKTMTSRLPSSSSVLKLRWSNHLLLGEGVNVSERFRRRARDAIGLKVHSVAGYSDKMIVDKMNELVELDTGGALRNSFDGEDVSGGVRALLLSALYVRSDWRGNVTLLDGETDFRDAHTGPHRRTRMFRLNDIIGYAELPEWDAEVLEMHYATANLSLVVVAPRSPTGLRAAVERASAVGAGRLVGRLRTTRAAVTMPLYTLRMTLLLPNKLQAMGMPDLLTEPSNSGAAGGGAEGLRLSHAAQRLMFWAETGRNAYKDDGIEWDLQPDMAFLLDRPYMFMVKWNDVVIMSGNFVL